MLTWFLLLRALLTAAPRRAAYIGPARARLATYRLPLPLAV